MFTISVEAEEYIADLFEQQDEELGLKIEVEKAGTPMANVTFNFARPKDLHKKYTKFPYKGFDAYISVSYLGYLKGSDVALKIDDTAKKLTITAPNAKGDAPKHDSPLEEKVQFTIVTEISPRLASHGGFCELVEITDKKEVILNFGGGCQGCSSVAITLKDGIERQLIGLYPEITAILDVTDHTNRENAYM